VSLDSTAERMLRARLAGSAPLGDAGLADVLRLLAKWRHQKIANTMAARDGTVVRAGPFAGLRIGATSTEGGHAPRLLGCHEQALHPHLERLIARGFGRVVNVGCADGYYAVGLARRLPAAPVHAHDISERARAACAEVAAMNGVADRVSIGGALDAAALDALLDRPALLVVDIEGAEDALIDPAAAPGIRHAALIVECHEGVKPGITQRIAARLGATHHVTRVDPTVPQTELPAWLNAMSHLDQLLALWEWREAPTPWLVMEPA
jgi:hypothetical protein